MKTIGKILLIIFLLTGFIYFDSKYIEPHLLITKRKTLNVPNWDKELNGFKIGIISDIHIGTGCIDNNKLKKIVKKINREHPDIIVILGDFDAKYIEKSQIPKTGIVNSLNKLDAEYGVLAILGNHDYEPPYVVKDILKQTNITLLENQSTYIKTKHNKIRFVGLKDLWHYKTDPKKIIGTNITDTPIIVLTHNPDYFPQIPDNVSLTLSGHTHGGEIYFPIIGSPTVPSEYGQNYNKGYVVENNKHLFITSGIGTLSRYRLFNPPEVVILTINKQTKYNKIINTSPKCKILNKNYIPYYFHFIKKYNFFML